MIKPLASVEGVIWLFERLFGYTFIYVFPAIMIIAVIAFAILGIVSLFAPANTLVNCIRKIFAIAGCANAIMMIIVYFRILRQVGENDVAPDFEARTATAVVAALIFTVVYSVSKMAEALLTPPIFAVVLFCMMVGNK